MNGNGKRASGKPKAAKKPKAADKPKVTAKPARTAKPVKATKPARTAKPVKTEKPVKTTKSAKAEKLVSPQTPFATVTHADETALLRTLGLAVRARQTVMGTELVCDALAEHKIRLVAEAADTSANTHKRLTDKCITYRTPCIRLSSDGGTLAAALGKQGSLAAVGVTGEIANAVIAAWERLTGNAPTVPEREHR